MVETYQVHGKGSPGEAALLAVNKLTRREVYMALDKYEATERVKIGTIMGVSVDGVIFTPMENWSPESKAAFADVCIVPWILIQELLSRVPEGTTGRFFQHRGRRQ